MGLGAMIGISAGAALLGTGVTAAANASSVKRANSTNYQIAQMNNEFNAEMMQKQMGFTEHMYDRSLEDTSPSAQMQRYRQAGINPYMAVGNISGGSGQTGSVSAAQASPVQMQPNRYDFSGLSQIVGNAIQAYNNMRLGTANERKVNQEADQLQIENQYKGAEMLARIADLKSSAKSKDAQAILSGVQSSLQKALAAGQIKNLDLQNQGLELANDYRSMENAMKAVELQNFPVQVKLAIANAQQDILTKIQGRKLSDVQIRKLVADTTKSIAEAAGVKFTNDMNKKAEKYLFDQIKSETARKRNNMGPEGGQGIPNLIYGTAKNIGDITGLW